MHEVQVVYATHIAQAVVAVGLGALLLWYQRRLGHRHLLDWGWSWIAYAIHLCAASTELLLIAGGAAAGSPLRIVAATAATAAVLAQAALLLSGARDLLRGELDRPRRLRAILPLLVLATLTSLVFLDPAQSAPRNVARVGVGSLALGGAFIAAAAMLWRARRRATIGHRVLIVSFAAFGAQQLQYFGTTLAPSLWNANVLQVEWLGFVDLVLQWFVGAGMAIALLEEERASAMRAAERAEHLAYHDALTGLPNRKLFLDRLTVELAQSKRSVTHLAVMFLDLDRFKLVNDSLGHASGDRLLRLMGDRISSCIRASDTLARLGGDEFALLFPGTDAEDAGVIAAKIQAAMRSPVRLIDQDVYATSSIGIAVYPEDGIDADALTRNADAAMYRAKEVGRDTFRFYRAAMNTRAATRLSLETALRRAVERQEFRLHYQPIVDSVTGSPRRAEALLRWQHPEHGLLSPARFLEAAEATGLIVDIGHWTLRSALETVRGWRRAGHRVGVTVNLSPRHFSEPRLVATIERMLFDAEVPGEALELEVTESTALGNVERAVEVMKHLRALGVRISLDDFGAGYSAMNHLSRLPIDVLKIDQSFVRGASDSRLNGAVIAAMTHLAHTVGVEVVAEGVETTDQLAFVRDCRVDLVQGYLIARPGEAAQVEPLLARDADAAVDEPGLPARGAGRVRLVPPPGA